MRRTKAFLLVVLVIGLVWEGLALAGYFGPYASISEAFWSLESLPVFTFLCGFLAGHLFFPRKVGP